MKSPIKPYFVAVFVLAAAMLGAAFAQITLGNDESGEVPYPGGQIRFTMDEVATNEAEVAAITTAEWQQMEDARAGRFGTEIPVEGYTTPVIPPAATVDPERPGEILDRYEPLPGDGRYLWSNGWVGVFDGHWMNIAAGSLASREPEKTSRRGLIRISTDVPELNREYFSPEPQGALKIVSFEGRCLELVAADTGASLQFDVSTRAWSCNVK